MITDRFVFSTHKQALTFAEQFERKHKGQFPLTNMVKAMNATVYYVFTSRLPPRKV